MASPRRMAFCWPRHKLGVAPRDCLVFEDTELGIEAATAAGMASVLVAQPVRENLGTAANGSVT